MTIQLPGRELAKSIAELREQYLDSLKSVRSMFQKEDENALKEKLWQNKIAFSTIEKKEQLVKRLIDYHVEKFIREVKQEGERRAKGASPETVEETPERIQEETQERKINVERTALETEYVNPVGRQEMTKEVETKRSKITEQREPVLTMEEARPVSAPAPFMEDMGKLKRSLKEFQEEFQDYLVLSGWDKDTDSKQVRMLKQLLGTEGRRIVRTLPGEMSSVGEVFRMLDAYLHPIKGVTHSRIVLVTRRQGEAESSRDYSITMKELSLKCDLGNREETLLRDIFIGG